MSPIRVLVADDHTILREGIRLLLSGQPDMLVAGEATTGAEAVAKAVELTPDVVLMDISMPDVNGIEATRRILAARPEARVLILSMHDHEEYVVSALEAGAAGYVLKQTAAAELVSAIRAVHRGESYLYPAVARTVVERLRRPATAPGAAGGAAGRRPDTPLTARELEVLKLVAEGLSNQEIAERLFLSVKAVQAHRAHIMEKLDLHDRVDLVKYALRIGLIRLDGPAGPERGT